VKKHIKNKEEFIEVTKQRNLNRILSKNIPITKGFYDKCSDIVDLPKLDNFIIEKVNRIDLINLSAY
jgi:hypothetical protein